MAVNLPQSTKFNVGLSVKGRLDAFRKSRAEAQTAEELKFLKQVSEQGMGTNEQLAFRQAQVEREQAKGTPDPDYITEIKKEISRLSKQARFEKIRKSYQDSQSAVIKGTQSLESYLELLKTQLKNENDPEMTAELRTQISQAEKDLADNQDALLTNEVEYAKRDKSISLIDQTLDKVKAEKAKALGLGNTSKASALDLKIQGLEQAKVQVNTENRVTRLAIAKSKKASAVGYLQSLNDELSQSDSKTPVVINNIAYDSERAFWEAERAKYIATNFFSDLDKEYKDYVGQVSAVSGKVSDVVMKNIQSDYQNFAQRPELAPYLGRLEQSRVSSLSEAVSKTATAIKNEYVNDLNVEKAVKGLENLNTMFGISTEPYIQDVIQNFGQQRAQFVQGLYSTVSDLVSQGQSYSSAVNTVLSSVKNKEGKLINSSVSNKDVATKTPEEILKAGPQNTADQLKQTELPLNQNQNTATPPTPAESAGAVPARGLQMPETPVSQPAGTSAPPINTPANQNANPSEYVVQSGDTLSGIAKKLMGDATKYSQIFELNKDILKNPNQIRTGQKLKIPQL